MDANRGRYRIVAGATDTLPWAREGRAGDVHIPALIDVAKIPDLREISVGDKRVRRSPVRWDSAWPSASLPLT